MKKRLLLLTCLLTGFAATNIAQTRYLEEVFSNVTVTSNVAYGQNYTVLTGSPLLAPLMMDVYEPAGDSLTGRPLIVYLPTGSFLPRYINQLCTGDKTDSTTVEMCKRLARQGYVVAACNYRTGWNPALPTQEERTQSILQAVFRALQDTKTAVRFFRKDHAETGNTYGINPNRIAIGGQGSGGYVSLAYGSVDKLSEIQLTKFYNPTTAAFMVDTAILGDWDGYGGNPALNYVNHAGYPTDVSMTFNIGGAIGDSSWIDAGEVPTVSYHGVADAFAPYTTGIVYVPGTTLYVIEVSGGSVVSRLQNANGNNDVFKTPAITDSYTTAADGYNTYLDGTYGNGGDEGLYPFVGVADGNGPWEWWSNAQVGIEAPLYGADSATCVSNSYASNPVYEFLGEATGRLRALGFVDTIQGYLAPRLYRVLIENTPSEIDEMRDLDVSIYPNPSNGSINFISKGNTPINRIDFYATTGKLIRQESNIGADIYTNSNLNLSSGMYIVNVHFDSGIVTKKIIVR
ncbi:T9SS type A sorting domain-containing protein [Flavobacteriales bacterium]|nr:T9SS type A sorting domain-containing protein [Flavobacteriales bacterium]